MSEKYLYITGDSYCFYRDNPEKHWPAILAKKFNLTLIGNGFPGHGWWPSKLDFFEHYGPECKNNLLEKTEIFIFCHTDIHRPVTGNTNWIQALNPDFLEYHFKFCSDPEVDHWCASHWYKELNEILNNKKVINLHCFDTNRDLRNSLPGKSFSTSLVDLSTVDHGGIANQRRSKEIENAMNKSHNHLTPSGNVKLADNLIASIV